MRERAGERFQRIDTVGGRLVARFWGTLLLFGIVVAALPIIVVSISNGSWTSALTAVAFTVPGLALVRHLFSSKRRLSDME